MSEKEIKDILEKLKSENSCVAIITENYTYKGEIKETYYKKSENSCVYVILFDSTWCTDNIDLKGKNERNIPYHNIKDIKLCL